MQRHYAELKRRHYSKICSEAKYDENFRCQEEILSPSALKVGVIHFVYLTAFHIGRGQVICRLNNNNNNASNGGVLEVIVDGSFNPSTMFVKYEGDGENLIPCVMIVNARRYCFCVQCEFCLCRRLDSYDLLGRDTICECITSLRIRFNSKKDMEMARTIWLDTVC